MFHQPTTHDYTTSYRLPYALIEGEGIDPPQSVEVEPFKLPLPTSDPYVNKKARKKKPK